MRSEDAVEIVRASLALALPTATAEGVARAAETIIRWGAEDVAEQLNAQLSGRLLLDILEVAGVAYQDFDPAEPEEYLHGVETAARYRTWSRTEGMEPLTFLPRPPDDPTTPHNPDGPSSAR
ncbi:hypothetical protein J7F03_17135 [Streptomyces sp. ISL-43]|uniref:hypothetical protein n=1 Tax=Streptomyces sp. ISL-43 TaxID=2819183 RepID=UPI001BE8D8A1|nr:hypothetical protein [Streptomyces sp. ISL-43]MBT2448784.1 hypothetical protein [Streptomyces sp. ISL-43]